MSEQKRQKGKHLTWDDRHEIQNGLREHRSFKEIADIIGCSPDTISKEIRKHRYHKKQERRIGTITRSPNNCKYRETCRRKNVCNKKGRYKCKIPCRECLWCNELCPNFVFGPCPISSKAPYVCNNCYKSKYCLFDKYLYNASYAHKEYLEELHESRKGIDLTRDELAALDELVSPLIKKGQPLVHIMEKHKDEIPCSLRTLYHYIDAGYLTAKNIDMRRTVRYRKRKHYVIQSRVSPVKKKGHQYKEFQEVLQKTPDQRIVEMDTVEGVKGGKLLHTFFWRENKMMLAFLIDSKEMKNTVGVLNRLEEQLGSEMFRELFPVILTDNGCEFADPMLFEIGLDGEKRTSLYYCEPRKSEQKGGLEKNHEYIRYILPKGSSFDELDQEKVLLMINHINNTTRPKLHGSTPMKRALKDFGPNVLDKLGLYVIPPDDIYLKPQLLK